MYVDVGTDILLSTSPIIFQIAIEQCFSKWVAQIDPNIDTSRIPVMCIINSTPISLWLEVAGGTFASQSRQPKNQDMTVSQYC